eukprot:2793148-Amphidinium_carterae.1
MCQKERQMHRALPSWASACQFTFAAAVSPICTRIADPVSLWTPITLRAQQRCRKALVKNWVACRIPAKAIPCVSDTLQYQNVTNDQNLSKLQLVQYRSILYSLNLGDKGLAEGGVSAAPTP